MKCHFWSVLLDAFHSHFKNHLIPASAMTFRINIANFHFQFPQVLRVRSVPTAANNNVGGRLSLPHFLFSPCMQLCAQNRTSNGRRAFSIPFNLATCICLVLLPSRTILLRQMSSRKTLIDHPAAGRCRAGRSFVQQDSNAEKLMTFRQLKENGSTTRIFAFCSEWRKRKANQTNSIAIRLPSSNSWWLRNAPSSLSYSRSAWWPIGGCETHKLHYIPSNDSSGTNISNFSAIPEDRSWIEAELCFSPCTSIYRLIYFTPLYRSAVRNVCLLFLRPLIE